MKPRYPRTIAVSFDRLGPRVRELMNHVLQSAQRRASPWIESVDLLVGLMGVMSGEEAARARDLGLVVDLEALESGLRVDVREPTTRQPAALPFADDVIRVLERASARARRGPSDVEDIEVFDVLGGLAEGPGKALKRLLKRGRWSLPPSAPR